MKRIIDLSHPITGGMLGYPGDPKVEFERVSSIKQSGYNVTRFTMGTHAGTHIDAPSHVLYADRNSDDVPLDTLVGPAEVLDLGDLPAGSEITAAHLDVFAERVREGARVLLKTGWSDHFGDESFYTGYPGITDGAAAWLTSRRIRLLGIEQPSVHPVDHLQVHKTLLAAGVLLVESMADLRQVTSDRVFLAVLPLRLVGLDGSPARAIAIEGGVCEELDS